MYRAKDKITVRYSHAVTSRLATLPLFISFTIAAPLKGGIYEHDSACFSAHTRRRRGHAYRTKIHTYTCHIAGGDMMP